MDTKSKTLFRINLAICAAALVALFARTYYLWSTSIQAGGGDTYGVVAGQEGPGWAAISLFLTFWVMVIGGGLTLFSGNKNKPEAAASATVLTVIIVLLLVSYGFGWPPAVRIFVQTHLGL